jgi:hypothetical protein
VLTDYYLYRESIEVSLFFWTSTEDVFEGGLEGMDGALISYWLFEKHKAWSSSRLDPYIEEGRRDAAM